MIVEFIRDWFSTGKEIKKTLPTKSFVDGMETGSNQLLKYHTQTKCKTHWDYHGLAIPTNNCNVCWQMYSEKRWVG